LQRVLRARGGLPERSAKQHCRDALAVRGADVRVAGVLVEGAAVRSCLMLAVQANGADVVTVEGLADGEKMHPVQEAFWDSHAFQCGFCTPGFVMTSVALLRENPDADEAEVREVLSGNICRCSGYQTIVEGVLLAGRKAREEGVAL